MAEEEMTLDEYVSVLPSGHRARKELARLKSALAARDEQIEKLECDLEGALRACDGL